jgi:uncharacterized protein
MVRVVVDTNVLVSGILVEEGACAKILQAARGGRILMILSPAILAEFEMVIRRSHIAGKYPAARDRAHDFVLFLIANAEFVEGDVKRTGLVAADPKDDMVVACALEGNAEFIVSGDQHLTDLNEFEGIPILPPSVFVKRVKL